MGGDDKGDDDVIDAHMKTGDIYRDKDNQFSEARKEYQVGLATCLAALTKHPDGFNLLRDRGKAFFRIAELLRTEKTEGTLDEARAFYRQASEVQDALITRNAREAVASPKTLDLTLKSNLASTDTHWGMLETAAGRLDLALPKFEGGAALNEELVKAEPGIPQWVDFVAPSHRFMGETLEGLKRPDEALTYYRKFADTGGCSPIARRGGRTRRRRRRRDSPTRRSCSATARGAQPDRSLSRGRKDLEAAGRGSEKADVATNRYHVVLGFAHVFDAKWDWPMRRPLSRGDEGRGAELCQGPLGHFRRDKAEIAREPRSWRERRQRPRRRTRRSRARLGSG